MSRAEILAAFPNISEHELDITSPRASTYNCIAYAAGDQRRWWWPDPDGLCYWPPGVQRSVRLATFQSAFECLGYRLTTNNEVEPGIEKIALFCKDGKPTHAARQLEDGTWSSKLGNLEDISHNLSGVEGDCYGRVAAIMARMRGGT
jgi:hypothetical protein